MDAFSDLLRRLGLDLTTLANQLATVLGHAIVRDARPITVTIAAGATSGSAPHGLGRPYQGAHVQWQSGALSGLYVAQPGGDSATLVTVGVSAAPVNATTVSLWVY